MRRVAITGIGIVSSIGNNVAEVTDSLREGRSGIVAAPEYAELGFRSQIHGTIKMDIAEHIDRKQLRFMGDGAAYAVLAMEQAIADSGLTEEQVSNPRTGLIAGSGGPSTANMMQAFDTTREKGPKARRPLYGAALHVVDCVSLYRHLLQDQGGELLHHFGLLDIGALHFIGGGRHPQRQPGHCLRRRRRGASLDPVGAVRRDGGDVLQI